MGNCDVIARKIFYEFSDKLPGDGIIGKRGFGNALDPHVFEHSPNGKYGFASNAFEGLLRFERTVFPIFINK